MKEKMIAAIFIFLCAGMLLACGGGSGGSGGSPGTTKAEGLAISGRILSEGGNASAEIRSGPDRDGFFFSVLQVRSAFAREGNDDGEPLEGATVQLLDADGNVVAETTTDADGKFEFLNVPPGTYTIVVTHPDIEELRVEKVEVIAGDITVVRGTVTKDGETGSSEITYEVDECALTEGNEAQMRIVRNLAEESGVSEEDIIRLREEKCLGWGEIAIQLKVHPSVIGIGSHKSTGGGRPLHAGRPATTGKPLHAGPPKTGE